MKRGHDDNEQRESVWVGMVYFHGAMGAGAHLPHGGLVEVFHTDADGARPPDVSWLVRRTMDPRVVSLGPRRHDSCF